MQDNYGAGLFGAFVGFIIGGVISFAITITNTAGYTNQWWEKECVVRGFGEYDKSHQFRWKSDPEKKTE